MSIPDKPDLEFEQRIMSRLMDLLIRAGLLVIMVVLCYRIFSPFLHLMVWAVILAVTGYPLHQWMARKLGGRQVLASILLVVLSALVIFAPSAALVSSVGDSLLQFIHDVQTNSLRIPAPRPGVESWPIVGERIHAVWAQAHSDLPGLVQSLQPKIGELARGSVKFVASIGGDLLEFLAAFIIAAIIMTFGDSAKDGCRAIFERIVGGERAGAFIDLSTATIRAVAQGVIGLAFLQAIVIGVTLLVAGVPLPGMLTVIVLVLGIAQAPVLFVTVPVIVYLWTSGEHGNAAALGYTLLLLLSGQVENALKPLVLGRGAGAPMPVILLGALGGLAKAGILGMFVGATLLALGYQMFVAWVAGNEDAGPGVN